MYSSILFTRTEEGNADCCLQSGPSGICLTSINMGVQRLNIHMCDFFIITHSRFRYRQSYLNGPLILHVAHFKNKPSPFLQVTPSTRKT